MNSSLVTNSLPPPLTNNDACYMTCAGRNDGIGAQLHGILSTMLFCNDLGIQYVHSPFAEIAHKPDVENNWENDWEDFFNLGKDETKIANVSDLNLAIVPIEGREKLPLKKEPNTLFVVPHCHQYADTVPNNDLKLKSNFLEKYTSNSKENYDLVYDPNKISIAVHIRRGDVSYETYPNRYTKNEFVAKLLTTSQSILSDFGMEISINIFSQGSIEDFQELNGENINFHLNQCLFTTFHNLVSADILIMGKSSFSYTAGLFSPSVKVYEPFWHQPQHDWIVVDELAQFDQKDFKNKVFNKLIERGLVKPTNYAGSATC